MLCTLCAKWNPSREEGCVSAGSNITTDSPGSTFCFWVPGSSNVMSLPYAKGLPCTWMVPTDAKPSCTSDEEKWRVRVWFVDFNARRSSRPTWERIQKMRKEGKEGKKGAWPMDEGYKFSFGKVKERGRFSFQREVHITRKENLVSSSFENFWTKRFATLVVIRGFSDLWFISLVKFFVSFLPNFFY